MANGSAKALQKANVSEQVIPITVLQDEQRVENEVSTQIVTLADGKQRKVPKIAPIEIAFENRTYVTEAIVLGDEPLLGVIPMEAMDLVVHPREQTLMVNPLHPNYPVALAK